MSEVENQQIKTEIALAAEQGTDLQAKVRDITMRALSQRSLSASEVKDVIHAPRHPYTDGLMRSIPKLGDTRDKLAQIDGAMPRLTAIPPGCAFSPRCPERFERCARERPALLPAGANQAACWLYAR